MTDVDLLFTLTDEVRKLVDENRIKMLLTKHKEQGDIQPVKVYSQDLPLKHDEGDEKLRNYIVVMIGDEDVKDDEWNVEVHFSINIEDRDKEHSGMINVLGLMNEIYLYFTKKGIVGKHYKMEKEAHKRLDYELPFPYYAGDLITNWSLALPNEEGLEELI